MNKIFKYITLLLLSLGVLVFPPKALAADLTVTCPDSASSCNISPSGTPLFEEFNVYPGYTNTRQITVVNEDINDSCSLVLSIPEESISDPYNLAEVVLTDIESGVSYFDNTLETLFNLPAPGTLDLGTIPVNDSRVYNWTVTMDPEAGNEYQGVSTIFDFGLQFSCGEPAGLTISKDNDQKGNTLKQGDSVIYSITVVNDREDTLYNVFIKDTQPINDYFTYQSGSASLVCSVNPRTPSLVESGNPFVWSIGDLAAGEECTLTYEITIDDDSIEGTHYNLAVAYGNPEEGETVYSAVVFDPFDIGKPGSLSAGYNVEQGEVLGASTIGEVLGAATGSPTFWLILALVLISLGSVLKIFRNQKMKKITQLIILISFLGFSLFNPTAVWAADTQTPAVAIVQLPEYLNKRDFEISYTALDLGEAGLRDVHLEYLKEGGLWQDLGTFTEHANKTSLDGSKINEDKKYYFKATACDNENNCSSSETSTTVDTSAPPKPENYSKQKVSTKTYKITWHNPDSDDLDKVYVYRADKRDFNADEGTKIASVGVSKNSDSEYTDWAVPDENKEYFYAIRSVDKAGNGSDLVGDSITTSSEATTPTGETVNGQTIEGQQPVVQTGPSDSQGEVLSEKDPEDKEEEGESSQETGEVSNEEEILGETTKKKLPWLLIIGGLGIIGIFYWLFKTSDD